jgi:cytidylate kinase
VAAVIVTLDGPAGAGKSSAARALARRLGFHFLDTGAMYRAVALAGLRRGVDWSNEAALAALARDLSIEVSDNRVLLDGEDVTTAIRTSQVTALTRHTADSPGVRAHLVELQRRAVEGGNFVTEGRDQGTVVFPSAECKIFLTASPIERAKRRRLDLAARGENLSLEEVLAQQNQRDEGDASRAVGPLIAAPDAIQFNTDNQTPEEVVSRLESLVRTRLLTPDP